jgi:uncharacterized protein YciI
MLFLGIARFKPDIEARRDALHVAFSAYLMQLNPRIRLGGPIFDESGVRSGVFMLLESDSIETIRGFMGSGPYAKAGLYERIEIDVLRLEVGHL